jgi:hypothetical protein
VAFSNEGLDQVLQTIKKGKGFKKYKALCSLAE